MKNFKFINQSLWAGSSPNQTGETLTRQNRIGVKSWLNRGLMLLIGVLIMSVNQMWARTYSGEEILYVKNIKPGGWTDPWKTSDGAMWATFDSDNTKYVATKLFSTDTEGGVGVVYTIQVPNGTHTTVTLHRGPSGMGSEWNNSGAITIDASKNYITDGYTSNTNVTWDTYAMHNQGVTYYLHPNSNWLSATQRFAAFFFDGKHEKWVDMTVQATGFYKVTVPDRKWPYIIFCRMNATRSGDNNGNNWDGANKWNQSDNMAPSSDAQGFNNCVWITDGESIWDKNQSWTKYAPSPAIWMTSDNDYTTRTFTNGSRGVVLSANTTYMFKIADGVESGWWGCSNSDSWRKSFVGQNVTYELFQGTISTQKVLILKTAGEGTYTFNWNSTDNEISVTYPTVTHPSSDYIYFHNTYGWSDVMANVCNGVPVSVGWNALPVLDHFNFDGEEYYYSASGGSLNIQALKETTEAYDDMTADLSVSKGYGKWYDIVNRTTSGSEVDARWKTFDATLTLSTDQGETENPDPTSVTVTYGASTNINTDLLSTTPEHEGYTFGGYYTGAGGSGTQVITAAEKIPTDLAGYTSSGNWIKTGSSVSATLYAKWTQNVVLDKENGDSNGSVTLTYNSSSHAAITNPTRNGYTFAGWYTGDDGTGNLVINTSGVLQASVTGYTGAGGIWTYDEGDVPTLHAKWTPKPLTFSAASDGNWNTAANWTESCVPTIEHDVTIGTEVTVNVNNAVAKSIAFSSGGKLIIPATGALEVAGTITNAVASKIVINSDNDHQGALIFNSTGETAATVELALQYADPEGSYKHFQMVAIPVSYVAVSEAFAGTGAYTFAWKHGTGWDQRGYYEGFSAFEAVLVKGKAGTSFSGALVSTANKSYTGLSIADGDNGDVYMFGNSWTAPIKRSAITCTNATISILNGSSQGWDGTISTDLIPALQGFAVVLSGAGSVEIDYDKAVRKVTSADRTTPLKAPQRYAEADPEPIILYVNGNELRTRIRLFEDETRFSDALDEGWEAYYLEGNGYAGEMYAVGPEKKMNVLATANLEGTVVGFVPGQATDYTISFAGDGKGYYLNDMKTGKSTRIDESNTYEFTSDPSTNATRFVISKTPMSPTGIEDVVDGSNARKQMIDGVLYIIRDGRIYNAEGSLVK